MSRVEINAGDRHIVVEHTGELAPITAAAMDLWQRTETTPAPVGPAAGFASVQVAGPRDEPYGRMARLEVQ